ncbi:MAG: hypothetical protein RSB71_01515 [Bacilli bacterium]
MKERLISEYVNRLTLNDVNTFALNNGIGLDNNELNLIYNYIKTDWHTIVYGNPRFILDDLKSKLDYTSYQKIESLYVYFKNRYL